MKTLQQSGLMQNQPRISEPNKEMAMASLTGVMTPDQRNQQWGLPTAQPGQPQQPQQQMPAPIPQNPQQSFPAPSNPTAQGIQNNVPGDYMEAVKSREKRGMDTALAQSKAGIAARGLSNSAIGLNLTNRATADLTQRMGENVNTAAYQQWQAQQQMLHEMEMSKYANEQQMLRQNSGQEAQRGLVKLQTDEELRGAQARIPITTQEGQAGIDLYKKNFPDQPLNGYPGSPIPRVNTGTSNGGMSFADTMSQLGYGAPAGVGLGGGPGSTPDTAMGGPGDMGPNFGKSQLHSDISPFTGQPLRGNGQSSGGVGTQQAVKPPQGMSPGNVASNNNAFNAMNSISNQSAQVGRGAVASGIQSATNFAHNQGSGLPAYTPKSWGSSNPMGY